MKTSAILLPLLFSATAIMAQKKHYLLAGTYTGTGSKGIYVFRYNPADASVMVVDSIESSNPSFLTIAPGGNFVYAVNEDADSAKPGGGVSAYAFDKRTGKLKFINKVLSGGNHPCHITMDKKGKWVIVANYSSGNFSIYAVGKKGELLNSHQTVDHSGSSVNRERQTGPHVHATYLSDDNKMLYANDLGTDKVMCYPFNIKTGRVDVSRVTEVRTDPGSGPRHTAVHPNKKFAYLMQELNATIAVYKIKSNQLTEIQTLSAHPLTYKGPAGSADIHVSPDGKFLYCSNRALSNTIGIFGINQKDGTIKILGHQYTMGNTPRNFNFDPAAKYVLVANQDSDNIVIFKRDAKTGLLTDSGKRIAIPKPVCLQWISIP